MPYGQIRILNEFFFTYDTPFYGISPPYPLLACLTSAAVYLTLVFIIWPKFRPESESAKKLFGIWRFWHNVFLCVYSGACCFATAYFMHQHDELNIFRVGLEPMFCNTNLPDWLYYLNLSFCASKIYEWMDTAFLVWLTKRGPFAALSFLHVYHHATTTWLFLIVANFDSTAKMGMLLNGFVHFLMYWHYAAPWPKPIVPFITIAQIIQLGFVTYTWSATAWYCEAYQLFYKRHQTTFWTPYAMVPVFLFFFLRFFAQRWITGSTHKKKPVANKKD